MSELRKDPIVGRWVVVAKGRAERPNDFAAPPSERSTANCPFCEGNEPETPPEVLAYRREGSAPNGPGWRVRVVPNKFPALEATDERDVSRGAGNGLWERRPGFGVHEVILETPRHVRNTAELSVDELSEVYWAYRQRLAELRRDRQLAYGLVFKNVGQAAGASLEHAHSQLVATPWVPESVVEEVSGAARYFEREGRCVYCDLLQQEAAAGTRIVFETPEFAAFCPFASRFPHEIWVVPKRHGSHFDELARHATDQLAQMMHRVLARLETALDQPAYNSIIHTAPFDTQQLRHYHWHIEIMPRVTNVAGFEWGTGCFINAVPPEEAAERLRRVTLVSSDPSTPLTDSPLTKMSTAAQATKAAQQGKDAVERAP